MTPAPIALFTYNRLAHTRRTVEALANNALAFQSDLHVFSDGPETPAHAGAVDAVRSYVAAVRGFRSVTHVPRPANLGLAQSIVSGVSETYQTHGWVIVMEDDLVTSSHCLRYLNETLTLYADEPDVISIHAYVYPIPAVLPETFFIRGADCWGWATWARGWALFQADGSRLLAELEARQLTREFDFNGTYGYTSMLRDQIAGRNNSWAIRWYASAFLNHKFTLYPGRSLVRNIGFDESGTHGTTTDFFDVALADTPVRLEKLAVREDEFARRQFERYFAHPRPPRWQQLWKRLTRGRGRRRPVRPPNTAPFHE